MSAPRFQAPPGPEAGFTLIEALVAMTVLAVGAVSLLTAAEGNTARVGAITDRTEARWVAEYRLAQLRLGLPEAEGPVEMLGRTWDVAVTRTTTADPSLLRVELRVGDEDRPPADGGLVRLTGYLDVGLAADAEAAP